MIYDEIPTAVDLFPALKDKCAVRLVNQLHSVKEQTRVQQDNEGFVNEVISFLTGESRRRQDYINQHLTGVVEQTVDQLAEVMNSLTFTNRTLGLVTHELQNLQWHTEAIAYEVGDLREKLASLEATVSFRFNELAGAVEEVDLRLRAAQQLDSTIGRWKAGLLTTLPIILRAYSVLEELWWGDFGLYIQRYPSDQSQQLLNDLRFRLVSCLAEDVEAPSRERLILSKWHVNSFDERKPLLSTVYQSVNFLSDWANVGNAPYTAIICNYEWSDQASLVVPHIISADRLGRELMRDMFEYREVA